MTERQSNTDPETRIAVLAAQYANNVRDCKAAGWLPVDWRHLEASYWEAELRKRPNDGERLV